MAVIGRTLAVALMITVPINAAADDPTPGDDCIAATYEVASLPYSDSGTTVGASNALNFAGPGPCIGAATPTGPEIIYKVEVDLTCTLQVNHTPGPLLDAVIWVVTNCDDPANSCVAFGDTGSDGDPEILSFSATAGTDYYVAVDGWGTSSGPYTLDIVEVDGATGCTLVPVELMNLTVE